MPDEILDVHAAIPQRTAVAVGFGDLRGEGHHRLKPGDESVR
jgi:hypothetical protein